MPKKYNNSPIAEAICEIKFSADTQWDITVPGLLFEKISDKYPNKEERNLQSIEVTSTDKGMSQKVSVDQYLQFSTEDAKKRISVGPRTLLVHSLAPYISWEDYKPEIDLAYNALSSFIDIKGFQRIGLRYINKIVIPESPVDLEKYFEFRPHGGKKDSDMKMDSFIVGYISSFCDGRDACKVQLATTLADKPGVCAFVLDLDYFLVKPAMVTKNDALGWVEDAHSEIEEVFEGCLTDESRKVFGETT